MAVMIVVGASSGLWWLLAPGVQSKTMSAEDIEPLTLQPRLMLGLASAPVAIVMFSDFECPFCARFATTTLTDIERELVETGRVSLYYRHSVGRSHPLGAVAAELAECADRTGDFWRVHDELFAAHARLSDALFDNLKRAFGLTRLESGECRDAEASVAGDQSWALKVGVTGTPFFLVGKRGKDGVVSFHYAFAGARGLGEFGEMVDALMKDAR